MKQLFVLIHSPLVGPLTWQAVGEALQRRGEAVVLEDNQIIDKIK